MNDAQEQLRQAIRRRLESDEAMQEHCRAHPDVARCTACGEPMIGGAVYDGTGWYHFGCSPGEHQVVESLDESGS